MKVRLMFIGKTVSNALKELEQTYEKRLSHYVSYERVELPDVKQAASLTTSQLKDCFYLNYQKISMLFYWMNKGQAIPRKDLLMCSPIMNYTAQKKLPFALVVHLGFRTSYMHVLMVKCPYLK
jgi:hypothetical protein